VLCILSKSRIINLAEEEVDKGFDPDKINLEEEDNEDDYLKMDDEVKLEPQVTDIQRAISDKELDSLQEADDDLYEEEDDGSVEGADDYF